MRALTLSMGILLVAAGVWSFACSGISFLALAFPIGLVLILDGAIESIIYMVARGENRKDNNVWMLTDSIITLILGVFVIVGQLAAEVAVPYVFGMWMLFSGVLRLTVALNINRKEKMLNFRWTLVTGIICTIAGVYGFLNDVLLDVAAGELIGVFLIIQALNTFELGVNMPHVKFEEEE